MEPPFVCRDRSGYFASLTSMRFGLLAALLGRTMVSTPRIAFSLKG